MQSGGYQDPKSPSEPPPPYQAPGYQPPPAGQYQAPPYQADPQRDPEASIVEDDDFNMGYNFEFTEQAVRLAFVRKVYGILLAQLAVTIGIMAIFIYITPVRDFSRANPWMWGIAFAATFICIIVLACCPDVRRTWPTNFIILGIFTVCESVLLGAIASCYEANEVIIAVAITAAVALGLTIFAMQTKIDFTMMSGALLVLLLVLFCFGLFCLFIQNNILHIVYASLGALVFSLYLVFDTQLMLGGRHKYSLSPEEYIFAALNLYLDIVNMFLFILSIIGRAR